MGTFLKSHGNGGCGTGTIYNDHRLRLENIVMLDGLKKCTIENQKVIPQKHNPQGIAYDDAKDAEHIGIAEANEEPKQVWIATQT